MNAINEPRLFTVFRHVDESGGNCGECSTEFTPMIEFCGQCSIKSASQWLVPLPLGKMPSYGWKSVLHLLFEK